MKDIEYSVQNPMVFIVRGTAKSSYGDWLSEKNDCLWGNPDGYGSGTPVTYPKNKDTYKSVYDPCPSGYKVAPRDLWANCTIVGEDNIKFGGYSFIYCWKISNSSMTDYYAITSGRPSFSGQTNGMYRVYIHTSSPLPDYVDFWKNNTITNGVLILGQDYSYTLTSDYRANGFEIRCVKIEI